MNPVMLAALATVSLQGPPVLIDGFDRLDAWTPHPADGVDLTIRSGAGRTGRTSRALQLDFAFRAGGGYAIARRPVAIDLPANYAFSFWIRGIAPSNTIEFKLVDSTGENVWWYTERDAVFDGAWRKVTIRQRQITFAWGPRGGGRLDHVAAIELVITAGKGSGAGSVWIDDLTLTPRPEASAYTLTPRVTASVAVAGYPGARVLDGDTLTSWRAPAGTRTSEPATLTLDFLQLREFGGVTLDWESGRHARAYTLLASDDGRTWRALTRVRESDGGRDYFYLPDTEARYLRLSFTRPGGRGAGLRELRIEPLEWAASRNAFFSAVARETPRGTYPRAFVGERAPWTVVGLDGAREEALLGADGAIEAGAGAFSLEPFLVVDGRLLTWADVELDASLARGDLPLPSVRWRAGPVSLTISAFATGAAATSSVVARYRLDNTGDRSVAVLLYLAVRPFQVNPPFQLLNLAGGVARIDSLEWDGCHLVVNGDRSVVPLTTPTRVGLTTFEGGEIAEHLRRGAVPPQRLRVRDPFGAASGALAFPMTVPARGSWTWSVEIPLVPQPGGPSGLLEEGGEPAAALALHESAVAWDAKLGNVIALPASGDRVARTIRSTLAYILINRDGAGIQPGSRAYARSWIRDGALTSTALLRFGYADVVRSFLEWYAGFQYPNGKVPCCVDTRGADPVPEHDSHGEFIYLVAEYYRHTGDRALVERLWPNVRRAADYLDSLRQTRRTPEFATDDRRHFFGLLPPSISHEGYSAKPMHSYWDDFFALRGFKDAVAIAQLLGRVADAERLARMRDEFQRELYASIDRAMAVHHIDFIPGSADLGDFDATSTTIAVAPGGELSRLPGPALERTFERYWQDAAARRDPGTAWEAYTPYELRSVGTFLRLGRKDRALALLTGFLADQEPPAWNQWPEVVWRDPRVPKFIGDLPHTWVGADFLRSAADLFAWEREADSALVIGSGLAEAWLADSGVTVNGLRTWWGLLRFTARAEGGGSRVSVRIAAGVRVPPGGLVVVAPRPNPRRMTIDGAAQRPDTTGGGAVVVRRLPVLVVFEY